MFWEICSQYHPAVQSPGFGVKLGGPEVGRVDVGPGDGCRNDRHQQQDDRLQSGVDSMNQSRP
jgi:hypothetical protein